MRTIAGKLASRADRRLGAAISHAVCSHHRRRLKRIGWLGAIDTPAGGWAAGDPPPRPGNAFDVLIDGAEALPRMTEEIAGAESHVHIAGWYFTPHFALTRDGEPAILRHLLAELAEHGSRCACSSGREHRCRYFDPHGGRCARCASASAPGRRSAARSIRRSGRCTATTRRRSWSTTASPSSAEST